MKSPTEISNLLVVKYSTICNGQLKSMTVRRNANEHVLHVKYHQYVKTQLTETQTDCIILGCES